MSKLYGKVFLLTESNSTISLMTAKRAAKEGAIVICADKNMEKLTPIITEIRRFGGQCIALKLDVKSLESWHDAIEFIVKTYGKVDVFVNTVGLSSPKVLLDLSKKEQEVIYETNILAIIYGLETILPIMKEQKGGAVVNVSSIDGLSNLDPSHIYTKTNGTIQTLLASKALECIESNIRINSICPGTIDTPLLETTFPHINLHYKQTVPFPCIGKTTDIANGIIYLASDETSFISGAKLVINDNIMPSK